jgi:hypothetical protein
MTAGAPPSPASGPAAASHERADPAAVPYQRGVECPERAKHQPLVRRPALARGLLGSQRPADNDDLSAGTAVEPEQPARQARGVPGALPGSVGPPGLVAEALELRVAAPPGVAQAPVVGARGGRGDYCNSQREDEKGAELHKPAVPGRAGINPGGQPRS